MRRIRFIKSEKTRLGNPFRFQTAAVLHWPYALGGAFFIAAALLYWLFFSPNFVITRIAVDGNFALPPPAIQELIRAQLDSARWRAVSQQNIFALDSQALTKKITEQFVVEQVYVKKDRPHTLAITVSERPREAIWSTRGQFYALDVQGIVLGKTPRPTMGGSPVIYNESGGELSLKQQIISPAVLSFIAKLLDDERIKLLQPRFFIVPKSNSTELTLKVGEGWTVRFDAALSLEDQLHNLDLTLRNSIPPDKRAKLNYIDLRFGERVYVKYR